MGRILKRSFLRFFKLAIFDKLKFIHMGVEEQWACELGLHRRRCVTKHLAPTPLAYAAGFLLAETVPRKNRPFWWPFVKEKQQNTKQNKKNKKKIFICLSVDVLLLGHLVFRHLCFYQQFSICAAAYSSRTERLRKIPAFGREQGNGKLKTAASTHTCACEALVRMLTVLLLPYV